MLSCETVPPAHAASARWFLKTHLQFIAMRQRVQACMGTPGGPLQLEPLHGQLLGVERVCQAKVCASMCAPQLYVYCWQCTTDQAACAALMRTNGLDDRVIRVLQQQEIFCTVSPISVVITTCAVIGSHALTKLLTMRMRAAHKLHEALKHR